MIGAFRMKKILETITAIAPFLAPYPTWVKVLISIWVILSAVVMLSLILARPSDKKQEIQLKTTSSDKPITNTSVQVDSGSVSIENVYGDKIAGDKVEGDKIEKQVVFSGKDFGNSVVLEFFSIDDKKCDYKQYNFDPSKPLWPEDEDAIGVVYHPDGKVDMYGKVFSSYKEAEEYGNRIKQNRNHYSFSKNSIHKIYFERLHERSVSNNKAN
jgi:hypothetical protein